MWAVGMHHYGPKQLAVGEGYQLKWEQENKYDVNAMSITDHGRVYAYLKRENAFVVAKLMKEGYVTDTCYIKPKEDPEVLNRRTGPQQRVNFGCKIRTIEKLNGARDCLSKLGVIFQVIELK